MSNDFYSYLKLILMKNEPLSRRTNFYFKKTVIRIGHDNAGFCLEKLIVAPQ